MEAFQARKNSELPKQRLYGFHISRYRLKDTGKIIKFYRTLFVGCAFESYDDFDNNIPFLLFLFPVLWFCLRHLQG